MAPRWEYCILTRLSNGPDTKWYVNRLFDYSEPLMPVEVTEAPFRQFNEEFDILHAKMTYPILPAVLNMLGAAGWELLDDMQTGLTGGEGLVFRRPLEEAAAPAKKPAARRPAKAKKPAARKR
ncbi:MAG: hypothetical protein JNK29_07400 [Anaerolineales bacterium]|nr:hypothetical protein [Anaerolineales bacterium]